MASAQTNTGINATIHGLKPGEWVYCQTFDKSIKDSVKTVANGFHFKLNIPQGEGNIFLLHIGKEYNNNNAMLVYLDKGIVTITGNGPEFKDAKLSGTTSIKDYNAYNDFIKNSPRLKDMEDVFKKANDLYTQHDSVGFAALQPRLNEIDSIRTVLGKQWVNEHPNSNISAYIISSELKYKLQMSEVETMMNKLSASAKNNIPAKNILHSIEVDKLTGIGRTALDFTQIDTLGNPVSLKDFRGKYVLIDFWASWCHPCREENPNVVKAFNQYKDKNFTILSISFDEDKTNWLKAIQKDGLAWNHVSDLKGWDNAVGKEYDIEAIPANILIDPQGKIIAKDLHGDDLGNKLAEVLKN
jgi:peroxiredoxin